MNNQNPFCKNAVNLVIHAITFLEADLEAGENIPLDLNEAINFIISTIQNSETEIKFDSLDKKLSEQLERVRKFCASKKTPNPDNSSIVRQLAVCLTEELFNGLFVVDCPAIKTLCKQNGLSLTNKIWQDMAF